MKADGATRIGKYEGATIRGEDDEDDKLMYREFVRRRVGDGPALGIRGVQDEPPPGRLPAG